ncbi:MAG TPA: Rieske 2Fe-2S domain-containing protein [Burkholderiaceae bacterium]|nr:Rieske 2Fe-2S domain-containing protein [Burkholderiaceae bacterium]
MLSASNNELLTRVGSQTAAGLLLRAFWIPVLMSVELDECDGAPVRVRLLGESLVAFRDSAGRVGLLAEHCPHRQASLAFGRNEASGLRCVYHGWKFDVTGRCVDLPSEPPGSPMASKVRARAYRCRERGGLIWAYMGTDDEVPDLPDFEWALVPDDRRYMSKRLLDCNWAQALEGDIDSSHASFLHALLDPRDYVRYERSSRALYMHADGHPRYEIDATPYGLMIAARRDAGPRDHYWRVAQYVMPFTTMPAPYEDELYRCNMWVPVDDEHTMVYVIDWHPSRPISDSERASRRTGLTAHCTEFLPGAGGDLRWQPQANAATGYGRTIDSQRNTNYSGIREIWAQDKAAVESMGPILDRTCEHLGSSDQPLVHWRRRFLEAVRAMQQRSFERASGASAAVRSATFVLPRERSWRDVIGEHACAQVGTPPHPETV